MDAILQKFAGKIDAQSLVKTVEELRVEYIDDGLTKEDVPPILGRLMMESVKLVNDLVDIEVEKLNGKSENVYIGGFSQGCALSLAAEAILVQVRPWNTGGTGANPRTGIKPKH